MIIQQCRRYQQSKFIKMFHITDTQRWVVNSYQHQGFKLCNTVTIARATPANHDRLPPGSRINTCNKRNDIFTSLWFILKN